MKRNALLCIVIVLLTSNLGATVAGSSGPFGWRKIEYKIAQPGPGMGPKEIEELLNQLGEDGWLLVHAMPGLGLLLRR